MSHVSFNRPSLSGREIDYIRQALQNGHLAGDGPFTRRCHDLLQTVLGIPKALLTTSCTHALERLMTPRTRAIVPVHYAGVGCEMDAIGEIATRHGVPVVEDNAHGLFARYRGRYLGTFGCLATQSFHESKNFTCGEGGSWVDLGSSYLLSDVLHYVPLHRSRFGEKLGGMLGQCPVTEWASDRLLRLPLHNDLTEDDQQTVIEALRTFSTRARRDRPRSRETASARRRSAGS